MSFFLEHLKVSDNLQLFYEFLSDLLVEHVLWKPTSHCENSGLVEYSDGCGETLTCVGVAAGNETNDQR